MDTLDTEITFAIVDAAKATIQCVCERRNCRDIAGDPLSMSEALEQIAQLDLDIDLLLEALDALLIWLETGGDDEDAENLT